MGARGRDVIRADRRWEIAAAMVFVPTADVGELPRHIAPIVRGAFVHVRAVPTASLGRVFTHRRRTGPCAIARAPGPTAKARVSLQTAEHYVAVEAIAMWYRRS